MIRYYLLISCLCLAFGGILAYPFLHTVYLSEQLKTQQSRSSIGSEEDEAESHEMLDSLWRLRLCDPMTGEIPANIRLQELAFVKNIPERDIAFNNTKNSAGLQGEDWKFLGPSNVAGRIRSLAMDIDNEDIMLAGGVSGGLWRSTDAGKSWVRTSSVNEGISVTSIVQDTRSGRHNIWYYATGEGNPPVPAGDGIYISRNGGISWDILPSTRNSEFRYINSLVLDQRNMNESVLLASTRTGIQRSANGGLSWTTVLRRTDSLARLGGVLASTGGDIVVSENGIFYAALSGVSGINSVPYKIFRSLNGTNWTEITTGQSFLSSGGGRINLAVEPNKGNTLYVIASSGAPPTYHTLAKYTYLGGDDTGKNGIWEDKTSLLPQAFQSYGGYAMALGVHPLDSNTIFWGGTANYHSLDGLVTRSELSINILNGDETPPVDNHNYFFSRRDPRKMYIVSDQGIHSTTNSLSLPTISPSFPYRNLQLLTLNVRCSPKAGQ